MRPPTGDLDRDRYGTLTATVRRGKGGKPRVVPLGDAAAQALAAWQAARPGLTRGPALFVGNRGGRLTPRSVPRLTRAWSVAAGVVARPHPARPPPLLRHPPPRRQGRVRSIQLGCSATPACRRRRSDAIVPAGLPRSPDDGLRQAHPRAKGSGARGARAPNPEPPRLRSTTILTVRRGPTVAVAARRPGLARRHRRQVGARSGSPPPGRRQRHRRLAAGSAADGLALFERLDASCASTAATCAAPRSSWPRTGAPTRRCAGSRPCCWSPTARSRSSCPAPAT
ncbi:MAG: hypothetical protein HS111_14950 [Kofleriaceae bacterium]|nr:hypothetical protein [Kofleriaceae bacterium]